MSREFTMGIRLNYMDNNFTRGMRDASRNTNGFRDSMRGATTSADGLIGKLGGLAVALGGIAAGKKAFDWLIGANSNMQQYQNTLTVVLGSAEEATKTLAWANKFAAQTPFEIPQVVEATTRMAAYGISAQKTLGIVGDMASVMGKDLMQAVEAVADAQTGELERLKEFGITKGMIQEQAKALGSTPIDSKGSITDVKAFNAALFALMEKRFKGGMAMQAKSFKGMTSNVADFMGTMGRNLGKPLFDKAEKNLANFLDTLNKLQDSGAMDAFISKVHKVGAVVGNEMAYAQKLVTGAFRAAWKVSAPVFDYIKNNWADIKPFVQGVAIAIGGVIGVMGLMKTYTMAATIAMRLLSMAMLTNPIGWIILGVGLLIGLFIKMNGGIEGSKKKLLEMWGVAQKFGQAIVDIFTKADPQRLMDMGFSRDFTVAIFKVVSAARFMSDNLVKAWAWISATAIKYWPQILAAIMYTFNFAKNNIIPILKAIVAVYLQSLMLIGEAAKPLGKAIYDLFVVIAPAIWGLIKVVAWLVTNILWPAVVIIWDGIRQIQAALAPVITKIVTQVMQGFTAVLNFVTAVWPAIAKIIGWVVAYLSFVWAVFGPFLIALLQNLVVIVVGIFKLLAAAISFVWNSIVSYAKIIWAIFSGVIMTAVYLLTGEWGKAWESFKGIFTGVWEAVLQYLDGVKSLFYNSGKAIMETMAAGMKNMINAPVQAIKNVMEKVREFLPFSDAKKGPLSELTYSGGAIMTTLSKGVGNQSGVLQDAVNSAFSATAMGMDISATATAPQMAPTDSFSSSGTNIAPAQVSAVAPPPASAGANISVASLVGEIHLHAQPGDNGDDLYDQFIDRLHSGAKEAAAILSSADKEALV